MAVLRCVGIIIILNDRGKPAHLVNGDSHHNLDLQVTLFSLPAKWQMDSTRPGSENNVSF